MKHTRKELSIYVAAIGAGAAGASPFLPDTVIGSPRAIALAVAAGAAAIAVVLRGAT